MSHANAVLTPRTRLRLAQLVVDRGWTYATAAKMFMVAPRTAKKWADRYRAEGAAGMPDRSSRPHSSPTRTRPEVVRQIVRLRWRHRLGPVQIAGRLGLPASTVHAVLVRCRINRLSHIDRVTGEPLRRYEHPHPGSLIHVDVTKFGNIPDGGGHRSSAASRASQCRATASAPATRQAVPPLIGTALSTPWSTTTPGWPTPRSTTTRKRTFRRISAVRLTLRASGLGPMVPHHAQPLFLQRHARAGGRLRVGLHRVGYPGVVLLLFTGARPSSGGACILTFPHHITHQRGQIAIISRRGLGHGSSVPEARPHAVSVPSLGHDMSSRRHLQGVATSGPRRGAASLRLGMHRPSVTVPCAHADVLATARPCRCADAGGRQRSPARGDHRWSWTRVW